VQREAPFVFIHIVALDASHALTLVRWASHAGDEVREFVERLNRG
jgi:hypothetical protein